MIGPRTHPPTHVVTALVARSPREHLRLSLRAHASARSSNPFADVAALAARHDARLVVLLRVNHVAHAISRREARGFVAI